MCECACPELVTDWARGDVVCRGCGVVVEGHILDASPTYEAWTTTTSTTADRCRRHRLCREPRDPLAPALANVEACVSALGLATTGTVADSAKQLVTDLHAARGGRADNRRALAAAAVYFACKLEDATRELRLVAAACDVDVRALNAAANEFKDDALADRPYYARLFHAVQAGRLLDVFLDRLRLPPDVRKRVWRAARRLDERLAARLDCGRKPRTICCGVLHVALRAERVDVPKRELARACGVCAQTLDKVVTHIRAACKQLVPVETGATVAAPVLQLL